MQEDAKVCLEATSRLRENRSERANSQCNSSRKFSNDIPFDRGRVHLDRASFGERCRRGFRASIGEIDANKRTTRVQKLEKLKNAMVLERLDVSISSVRTTMEQDIS